MWNNSDFGGSGGFETGGFDSPSKGGGDKKGGVRGPSKAQTLVPVSCSMMADMVPQQEAIRIGAFDVQQITIVGQVKSCERDNLSLTYVIDDTTGTVKVRMWTESESDGEAAMENSYVRVIGMMKSWQDKPVLMAHVIRPVTDPNEVSCHLQEVTLAKMYYEKDLYAKKLAMSNAGPSRVDNLGNFMGDVDMKPPTGGAFNFTSHPPVAAGGPQGFQGQLYACLKLATNESGMPIQELVRRTGTPIATVRKAMDELCSEGLAYTTTDDDHFATTDQMF